MYKRENLCVCTNVYTVAGLPSGGVVQDTLSRHGMSGSMQADPSNFVVPTIGLPMMPQLQPQQMSIMPHVSVHLLRSIDTIIKKQLHYNTNYNVQINCRLINIIVSIYKWPDGEFAIQQLHNTG